MLKTVKAIVKNGRSELLEKIDLPEGTELLVAVLSHEALYWIGASQPSLDAIWSNAEDDVYGKLLEG